MPNIKIFDIKSFFSDKKEPTILIIGRRDKGKTVLICDILYHQDIKNNLENVTIITSNREIYKQYNINNIHEQYDLSIIKNVVKELPKKSNSFLVFDNCMYDMNWTYNKLMNDVLGRRKGWGLMAILALDYPYRLPPNMKNNIDYIFILQETEYLNLHHLYEVYASVFLSYDFFCHVLDECTQDNHCLVIKNNCEESCNLYDKIFKYRIEVHNLS